MKLMTDQSAEIWCADKAIESVGTLPADRLKFVTGSNFRVRVRIPDSRGDLLSLAYILAMTDIVNDSEEHFAGGLVWFQDWDIWSETIERVGLLLLVKLRGETPSTIGIRERPAHLLGSGELSEALALITLSLLFQWDAYFIPPTGRFFAFMSHHGDLDLVAASGDIADELKDRARRGGLEALM